jgi:hypothetical protein
VEYDLRAGCFGWPFHDPESFFRSEIGLLCSSRVAASETKLNTGAGKEQPTVAKALIPFAEEFEQIRMPSLLCAGHEDSNSADDTHKL